MVPTFTWGFVRSNFCLAIASLLPAPGRSLHGPDAHFFSCELLQSLLSAAVCCCLRLAALHVQPSGRQPYSPCARAMISLEIDSGTWLYEWNCIVYVARPWVRERRSVE